jgi:hypothetical protein
MRKAFSTTGEKNAYRLWALKPEGNSHLGRPRRRRVDDIRMDLKDIEFGNTD